MQEKRDLIKEAKGLGRMRATVKKDIVSSFPASPAEKATSCPFHTSATRKP
jgi:hypothetical protein